MSTKKYAIIGLSVVLSGVFLMAGGSKLAGQEMMVQGSAQWSKFFGGIVPPVVFRLGLGVAEVGGAVGLHVKPFQAAANAVLIALMVGAAVFHLGIGDGQVAVPVVLAALLGVLLALRLAKTSKRHGN